MMKPYWQRMKERQEENDAAAAALRQRLLDEGVTVTAVAQALGRDRSWVSRVLNGLSRSEPLLDEVRAYLDQQRQAA